MRRTVVTTLVFLLGSAVVVGLLTTGIIYAFRAALPSGHAPEGKPTTDGKPTTSTPIARAEPSAVEAAAATHADVGRCCLALEKARASAPAEQKAVYVTAASMCRGIENHPRANQALEQIRKVLTSVEVPPDCQ